MPTLGTATETNTAQSDILDLVDYLIPLLPVMKDLIEQWVTSLTPSATTNSVAAALQTPLTADTVIFNRYKDHVRTRYGIDLNVVTFASLTDQQRKDVLKAADTYIAVLLNLALFAKLRADEQA